MARIDHLLLGILIVVFTWSGVARANDPPAESVAEGAEAPATPQDPVSHDAATPQEVIYDRVHVVGSPDRVATIPGSAHVVTRVELERYEHDDVHRMLRRVPGINVQEEDGFGLRPNIGIRGTGVERSQKVLLLEDGVPIAPAPYSAPSAYYSPTAGRMEGLEVRKGSSAIRQGPLTTGGAINYVSTSIPQQLGGGVDLAGGEDGALKLHGHVGASYGRIAFLAESYHLASDGFKRLDGDPGASTGFTVDDYLLKLRLQSKAGARFVQAFEIKTGRTEQEGDETYLGLTRADFDRDPYRRYRGSREDHIETEHDQIQLRHFIQLGARLDVTTTVYRNDFFRNWRKNESTLGVSNRLVLDDPARYSRELAILRGEVASPDDALTVRNNRRDYFSQGVQSTFAWRPEWRGPEHRLQLGFRLHQDQEDRFQEDDLFAMRDGAMVLSRRGAPGSQANRVGEAEALAFFVQDEIVFGKWALIPGLRFETIDLRRTDYGADDPARLGPTATRANAVEVWIPGLALSYQARPDWLVFAGVHRGFSPPSPSSRPPTGAEDGTNYELGTRWGRGATRAEAVLFWNDYRNLLGTDTLASGGGGSGDQFNGGAVDVYGLELAYDTELYRGSRVAVPLRLAYTFTRGEFGTSFTTSFADWAPAVAKGDRLPYLPEHQLFAELGIEGERWSVFASASLVDELRVRAGRGAIVEPDRIPAHTVIDLAASYRLFGRHRLYLQLRNATDEVFAVARRPYGLRPGLPRTALMGVALKF